MTMTMTPESADRFMLSFPHNDVERLCQLIVHATIASSEDSPAISECADALAAPMPEHVVTLAKDFASAVIAAGLVGVAS
jgi:hypothetical protein